MKTSLKNNWYLIIAFAVFIGLNILGLIYHEKWLDEAQIWLIARDLSFAGILKQMHYELSPGLWYFILHPFAAAGFPYITQSIINSLIMIAAGYLFLRSSKLNNLLKILFLFSYFFAYEYSVISKSYSLTILFLMIVLALYQKRFTKNWWYLLVIALMANTNTIGMITAGTLAILYFWELIEKKKYNLSSWSPLILIVISFLIAISQIFPVADINHSNSLFKFSHLLTPINGFALAFFPWKIITLNNLLIVRSAIWQFNLIYFLIFLFIFPLIIYNFLARPKLLFFLLLNYFGLAYLLIFRDNGHLRHYGFFLVWLIFALSIEKNYPANNHQYSKIFSRLFSSALYISLIFLCFCGIKTYAAEIKYSFSPSFAAAEFIKTNQLENTYWITDSYYATSLMPYFPQKKLWQLDCQQEITFFQINHQCVSGQSMASYFFKKIISEKANQQDIIYITNHEYIPAKNEGWKLIYHNQKLIFGYDYGELFIYRYTS